ncbi:MAG: pantoate--beta-alanine ligase [Xanthomonadales bacterium]|nr:pantoate--beta-alanine ligase [Xanthomonadales bacterium]
MIEIIRNANAARDRLRGLSRQGHSIGFVPTMGALHEGHLSLVGRAGAENEKVVVSIYVNPTQYDDPDDLANYPRPLEQDLEKAETAGAHIAFLPDYEEIYADAYRFRVTENQLSRELEGAHRSGHFDGVLTVVLKLFGIVRPDRAYFGEKDWQQLQLVRDMASAFFLDLEVVSCPTVRESDGLAMSSRNARLAPVERSIAPEFHRVLSSGRPTSEMESALKNAGFKVDYVERRGERVLGAVRLGKVRLIDNVEA